MVSDRKPFKKKVVDYFGKNVPSYMFNIELNKTCSVFQKKKKRLNLKIKSQD